jgi:hypothetical protein
MTTDARPPRSKDPESPKKKNEPANPPANPPVYREASAPDEVEKSRMDDE